MRIAFTGAHGTGKTTLCEALKAQLASDPVYVSREVPRVIVDAVGDPGFFRRGNNSFARQLLVLFYQATDDRFFDASAALVLHDRTMVDHLAYTGVLFPEHRSSPEYTALVTAVRRWLDQYVVIFKVPIEFAALDDGVREADVAFQAAIDQEIDALYKAMGRETVEVRGTVEERARFVLETIAKLK